MNTDPTTYAEALALLNGTVRHRLAPNTLLERQRNGLLTVTLYDTQIVTYYETGLVELDTGGHLTNLTAERMNRYLPANVTVQRKLGGLLLNRVVVQDGHRFFPSELTAEPDELTAEPDAPKLDDKLRDYAEHDLYFDDPRVCVKDDAPVRRDDQAGGSFVQAWIFVKDGEVSA